jgi:hypothetical protein
MTRQPEIQPDGLARLIKADKFRKKAQQRLVDEIMKSYRAGSSTRVIAKVTGMSHTKVWDIVRNNIALRDEPPTRLTPEQKLQRAISQETQ